MKACFTHHVKYLRATTFTSVFILSVGLLIAIAPSVQAKSLVGSSCTKVNQQRGDGLGRTVICKKVGSKKIWQLLVKSKPKPQQSGNTPKNTPTQSNSPANSCTKAPEFTHDFIDPKFVRVVTPIGEQTGSGGVIAVRSYVHPAIEFAGQELPIFAPIDMTLSSASYYKPPGSSDTYKPEYSLYFEVGCGISVKFFHIKGVVGKIAGAVPSEPTNSSAGQTVRATAVKAGEQIGWYKLGETSVAFDFWVDNSAITNKFIVQSHFSNSNARHSVCPYDFYSSNKKSIWLAKLGAPGSNPIPGTGCGSISQGVPGTADGMWFISESTEIDRLVYDGAYQSQIMFSLDASGIIRIGGLNASGAPAQMMISSNASTWKKPTDITIGATHCWSNSQQSVRVNLISEKTMSVLVGAGSCDGLGNQSLGKMYYR
jgi:hypothetical protein